MADIERISSNAPWEPIAAYSRAVRVGNLIAVSGTTGLDARGVVVGINQMYVQASQALANIRAALERAGASMRDVIRTRMFTTDIRRFDEIARAHRECFAAARPASTLVEVARLVHPDMLIEIEADAFVPAHAAARTAAPARPKPASRAKPRPKQAPAKPRNTSRRARRR
jgi:enamine deaminase RidA (YjgF/YER057c/UK114 family)